MAGALTARGGFRLSFAIRDEAGMVANFRAYDAQLQADVRRINRRRSADMLELVHAYVAFDTGRMLRLVKVVMTPTGLAFEVGWYAGDFEAEGEPFYPPFVELGTRRMAAQPSLEPAWLETAWKLRADVTAAMQRAALRA